MKFIISLAMSVSRIRLSDADRFSTATLTELMVCSKRFCSAPRSARWVEIAVIAVCTVVLSVMSTRARDVVDESASAVADDVDRVGVLS